MNYAVILVAALADWGLTIDALYMGIAKEGNPVMAPVMAMEPWQSFAIKMGFTSLLVLLCVYVHRKTGSHLTATIVAYMMVALVLYQCLARVIVL